MCVCACVCVCGEREKLRTAVDWRLTHWPHPSISVRQPSVALSGPWYLYLERRLALLTCITPITTGRKGENLIYFLWTITHISCWKTASVRCCLPALTLPFCLSLSLSLYPPPPPLLSLSSLSLPSPLSLSLSLLLSPLYTPPPLTSLSLPLLSLLSLFCSDFDWYLTELEWESLVLWMEGQMKGSSPLWASHIQCEITHCWKDAVLRTQLTFKRQMTLLFKSRPRQFNPHIYQIYWVLIQSALGVSTCN